RLQAAGMPPAALFLAGHRVPRVQENHAPWYLLDDETLIDRLQALGGTHARLMAEPELRTLLLGTIRADLQASETYTAPDRQPLRCPLFVYAGDRDLLLDLSQLDRWRTESSAPATIRILRGGH